VGCQQDRPKGRQPAEPVPLDRKRTEHQDTLYSNRV
jgi:hypothetical protein